MDIEIPTSFVEKLLQKNGGVELLAQDGRLPDLIEALLDLRPNVYR